MKTLYDYCFYRIARAYKVFDDKDYCNWSNSVLFLTLGFVSLAIIAFIIRFFGYELTTTMAKIGAIPVIVLDFYFTFFRNRDNRRKYNRLEEKYKGEKYKTLKGWLIFFYVIGAIVVYCLSL